MYAVGSFHVVESKSVALITGGQGEYNRYYQNNYECSSQNLPYHRERPGGCKSRSYQAIEVYTVGKT